jgi:DUF218 domain
MTNEDTQIQGIIKRATTGQYLQHGSVDDADCVLGFSFGYQLTQGEIRPGQSNNDLAAFIAAHYGHLPKILQFEIADAMPETQDVFRIERHRIAGQYLNTREVAEQACEIIKRQGWSKAILVAHPNHVPRADAICKKLGLDTVTPKGLSVISFDPNSEQEWTRSAANWAVHEAIAIPNDAAKGWI